MIKATIDSRIILDNFDAIKSRVSTIKISPVIKADAYGLGAIEIVKILEQKEPELYYVATLDEALQIRPHTNADIAVFGGMQAGQENDFFAHNLTPALKSLDDIELWLQKARNENRPLPCQIHLDTGMNRTGIPMTDDRKLTHICKSLDIKYIFSHFISSEETSNTVNTMQIEGFRSRAAQYEQAYDAPIQKSLANSSGIINFKDSHFDMVRPGGALWGIEMGIDQAPDLKPAFALDAKVIQVNTINAGETVGYNQLYTVQKTERTATLAMGYADGLHWPGSNNAKFYWKGHPCKIAGSISMDLTTVLLPDDLPEQGIPAPGDYMELIGPNQRIETLAKDCGARAYEMQIALGSAKRVQKSYS